MAPAPTAFAYWKIDGDDANKTIHYYATAGEGRTAVTIDIGGIEYTGLDDSEREEIKKAVIEEPIVATDVRRLFYFFEGLVSITDLGKLDTTSATSFESMFHNCNAIEELDVSGLETNSLTDTSFMFSECSSLTKLTFGNYFDTSKVRSMPRMFVSCTEITELDLTSFNTSSVTDMNYMFFGCSNLKKIYVSDYFTVENVDISDDMFTDSTQLEGGSGTLYSNVSEPYDKTYAHIDGGTTNPGFFSGASTPSSDKNFYVLYYADDANYSTWTLSEKHISASADATAKEAFANDLFNNCIYNLSAAEPRGFYKIHDGSESYDVDNARSAYNRSSTVSVGLETNQLIAAYDAWVSGGAANDVYYGTLINTYFYLLHYDSDGNPAFIQVKCTDTEDTVNAYLATIKGSAPSGKKFKTWQYWHADWYEEEGYDYSDDGEKEFYKNLVENPSNFETDADVIETFNAWTPEPYENRHYGAIYEDDTPAPTTYTVTYNQNLPSGYTISASKTWYTDSTSDDLSSNPIKITGSAGMTCENADGYVRKLETWNTLADKSGTPYMFAQNISSPAAFTSNPLTLYAIWSDPVAPSTATDKFYIISYGNPTEYPNEKKIFAFDSTTTVAEMENFVANNISKCINPSGKAANGFYDMSELIPAGADDTQVRQILNNNYDLTKEKIRTLDKIAVIFEDYLPDPMGVYLGITFEGSTPTPPTPTPTPRPYVPGGGDSSSSSSGSSDPTHGPMGDLTKNPLYADTLNGTNNIPESKMVSNDALATTLKSYPENVNSPMVNARDDNGNVGYGQWLRVPNTTTWYFLSGSFNQGTGTTNTGFLANGWFNLGWDGQDKWYYFDGAGVMKIGWHQEGNKIYYLQADFSDNWYGKAMTGQQMIGGQIYNFDSNGALIQ